MNKEQAARQGKPWRTKRNTRQRYVRGAAFLLTFALGVPWLGGVQAKAAEESTAAQAMPCDTQEAKALREEVLTSLQEEGFFVGETFGAKTYSASEGEIIQGHFSVHSKTSSEAAYEQCFFQQIVNPQTGDMYFGLGLPEGSTTEEMTRAMCAVLAVVRPELSLEAAETYARWMQEDLVRAIDKVGEDDAVVSVPQRTGYGDRAMTFVLDGRYFYVNIMAPTWRETEERIG